MEEIYFSLCKAIDSPVSLGAWLRFKYTRSEVAHLAVRPSDYLDYRRFQEDYAVVSYLSKWKGLPTAVDLDSVALQSFADSEVKCRETNSRLRFANSVQPEVGSVIHRARRKIARLLGEFEISKLDPGYGWGPGASTDLKRSEAFLDTKISLLPIPVSRSARALLRAEIERDLHWSASILGTVPEGEFCLLESVFVLDDECRIDTVPKNAKTNRVIAIEPRGNSFLQKGFGGYIRRRLRTVGVDLDDQTINQRLAAEARTDGWATLDLKAASDTVSKEAVWSLLPYDWAASLDAVRSRYARLPEGDRVYLEKFSSMGNGFTFELESLIFWALCQSVSDGGSNRPVAVYGDDLIVAREDANFTIEVLTHFGFEINTSKSFISGDFFESCGKHYFQGVDVTPAYQKEVVTDALSAIRLGNRLIRLSHRFGAYCYLDRLLYGAWDAASRLASSHSVSVLVQRGKKRVQVLRPATWFQIPFSREGDDGWAVPFDHEPSGNFSRGKFMVLSRRESSFPANDSALLSMAFRKGVKTESPFMGSLAFSKDDYPITPTRRAIYWQHRDTWL